MSEIIRTFGFQPLFGRRAYVAKVARLNEINNPDLIFPGQEIHLPFRCEEDAEQYVLIDRGAYRLVDSAHLLKVKTRQKSDGRHELVMRRPDGREVPFVHNQQRPGRSLALEESLDNLASATASWPPDEPLQKPLNAVHSPPLSAPVGKSKPLDSSAPASDDLTPFSTLSGALLFGFARIDSMDREDGSTALLLSRPITGARLAWDLHWSPKISSEFNIAFRQIEMQSASVGLLEKEKQSLSGMGMNFSYVWSAKFKSILGVNFEERLFVSSPSSGVARLEAYQQPSFDLKLEHEVVRAGPLSMDVLLGARQLLATQSPSASLEANPEYLLGASFRQQLSRMQIELKLQYLRGQLNSNLTNQENSAVEAQFGVKMEIGK